MQGMQDFLFIMGNFHDENVDFLKTKFVAFENRDNGISWWNHTTPGCARATKKPPVLCLPWYS